jgi:hypothetical protein
LLGPVLAVIGTQLNGVGLGRLFGRLGHLWAGLCLGQLCPTRFGCTG